jgi:hypothetical protein
VGLDSGCVVDWFMPNRKVIVLRGRDEKPPSDMLVTPDPRLLNNQIWTSGKFAPEIPSFHRPGDQVLLVGSTFDYEHFSEQLRLAKALGGRTLIYDRGSVELPSLFYGECLLCCRDFVRASESKERLIVVDRDEQEPWCFSTWDRILKSPGKQTDLERVVSVLHARSLLNYDLGHRKASAILVALRDIDIPELCALVLADHMRYIVDQDFDFMHRGALTGRRELEKLAFHNRRLEDWIPSDFEGRLEPRLRYLYRKPATEAWERAIRDCSSMTAWLSDDSHHSYNVAPCTLENPYQMVPWTQQRELAEVAKLAHYRLDLGPEPQLCRGAWPQQGESVDAHPQERPTTEQQAIGPDPEGPLEPVLVAEASLEGSIHSMKIQNDCVNVWTSREADVWVSLPRPAPSLPDDFRDFLCPVSEHRVIYDTGLGGVYRLWDSEESRGLFETASESVSQPIAAPSGTRVAFHVSAPMDCECWCPQMNLLPADYHGSERWLILDPGTGKIQAELPFGEGETFSHDGRWFALAGRQGCAVFDLENLSVNEFLGADIYGFHFLPNGNFVYSSHHKYTIVELATMKKVQEFEDPNELCTGAGIGCDLLTGEHSALEVYGTNPYRDLYRKPDYQLGAVSLDGRFLLAKKMLEGKEMEFDLLNASSGACLGKLPLRPGYYEFAFTPDGSHLASMEVLYDKEPGQKPRLSWWRFVPQGAAPATRGQVQERSEAGKGFLGNLFRRMGLGK